MLLVHALNGRPGIGREAAVGSSLGSWAWDRFSTWPCEDSWYSEGWAVLWGALSFSIGHAPVHGWRSIATLAAATP